MTPPMFGSQSCNDMLRTEQDTMLAGSCITASRPVTQAELAATHRWLVRYNAALDMAAPDRHALLVAASRLMVCAGSVVTRDLEAGATAFGHPARVRSGAVGR